MWDENAFGILVSYFHIEEDEYAEEDTEEFVARFTLFDRLTREFIAEMPLGQDARSISFGHAIYLELADGNQQLSPIKWSKDLRARLAEHELVSAAVITHGGRWTERGSADAAGPSAPQSEQSQLGDAPNATAHTHLGPPSECLRRALHAETASHGAPSEEERWGPGLYVDTEAIEALGLRPKNDPTVLAIAGAEFYRLGS